MSSLKYRLRKVLPSLSVSARGCRDKQLKGRYYFLKAVANSSKSISRVCRLEGSSRDQFYKWGEKLAKASFPPSRGSSYASQTGLSAP